VSLDERELFAVWQSLVRVCEPILCSRDDAEDCASDALVSALAGPNAVANREAWLVTVAKRRAVDQLRQRIRSRTRAVRLVGQHEQYGPDIAEDVADNHEARWLSREAPRLLTCPARSVLDIVAAGGTVDDAARELGMTKRSAEAHLRRARLSLRAHARREAAAANG